MGSGFSTFISGAERFGADAGKILTGGFSGASAGAGIGTAIEPGFGTAIGGVLGGIVGASSGIAGTIKDIVHFSHHQNSPSTQGGPSVLQLAQSASQSRAAAFAATANTPQTRAYQRALDSGMTAGGAFISSGLSRLPGVIAQGQLNGVFNRTPGVNPRTALLLGNGAIRSAMAGGALSATSQVAHPFMDAVYGYGHAMASSLYGQPAGSSVPNYSRNQQSFQMASSM